MPTDQLTNVVTMFTSLFSNALFWIILLASTLASTLASGCSLLKPPKMMPAEYAEIANTLNKMVEDQGVIEKFVAEANAHGINTGIKTTLGIEVYGKIGLDGIAGSVSTETGGHGTLLSTGTRDILLAEFTALLGRTDPEAVAARAAILSLLDQQNRPIGGTPPIGPTT